MEMQDSKIQNFYYSRQVLKPVIDPKSDICIVGKVVYALAMTILLPAAFVIDVLSLIGRKICCISSNNSSNKQGTPDAPPKKVNQTKTEEENQTETDLSSSPLNSLEQDSNNGGSNSFEIKITGVNQNSTSKSQEIQSSQSSNNLQSPQLSRQNSNEVVIQSKQKELTGDVKKLFEELEDYEKSAKLQLSQQELGERTSKRTSITTLCNKIIKTKNGINDLNSARDAQLLHKLIKLQQFDTIVETLINTPLIDFTVKDTNGNTPFLLALEKKRTTIAKKMLTRTDVSEWIILPNKIKETAFEKALLSDNTEIAGLIPITNISFDTLFKVFSKISNPEYKRIVKSIFNKKMFEKEKDKTLEGINEISKFIDNNDSHELFVNLLNYIYSEDNKGDWSMNRFSDFTLGLIEKMIEKIPDETLAALNITSNRLSFPICLSGSGFQKPSVVIALQHKKYGFAQKLIKENKIRQSDLEEILQMIKEINDPKTKVEIAKTLYNNDQVNKISILANDLKEISEGKNNENANDDESKSA